jgi:hypothetical protein
MRIDEFYNPEDDRDAYRAANDTRKPVLTLEQLNKLRKIREIKRSEQIEHEKFVRVMYAQPAQEQM